MSDSPDPSTAAELALIGVPSSAGARMAGQENAPRELRAAGLVEALRSRGQRVVDLGDLPAAVFSPDDRNPKRRNLALVESVLRRVVEAVDASLAREAWPLVIGGDCTVTLGVLASLVRRYPDLGLVYFDGDLDLNTPETTLTGILDGMVLAHILGEGADELSRLGPRYPLLQEPSVALFGYSVRAGGLDPIEIERLRHTRMAKFPLEEIQGRALVAAADAFRALESRAGHVLVHFDVDVIDHDDLPAVDVPHTPGLVLDETRAALEVLLESPRVVGLVVTEFNADQDPDGRLARRLVETIAAAVPLRTSSSAHAAAADRGGSTR